MRNSKSQPHGEGRRCALAGLLGLGLGLTTGPGAVAWAQAQRKPWPKGKATPALELPLLDGATWRLANERGKVVLLNFWASWCEPCRAEMPSLDELARVHADRGLVVLGVNHKESERAIRRFLEQQPSRMAMLRDSDGEAARAFGVRLFPSTVLIARNGMAKSLVMGETDWTREPAMGWVSALL